MVTVDTFDGAWNSEAASYNASVDAFPTGWANTEGGRWETQTKSRTLEKCMTKLKLKKSLGA